MAKVTGPLFSMGASGQVGKTLVFGAIRGVNYVREWLKPSNSKTADQGDRRQILGSAVKAIAKVVNPSDFVSLFSASIPSGQTWSSYLVQIIVRDIIPTAVTYEAIVTEFEGHAVTGTFASAGASLGYNSFLISYAGTEEAAVAGFQLYLIAKVGVALGLSTGPFATALASWDADDVADLVTLMTTEA